VEENFDILVWWKKQQLLFPVLSMIAKDYLAIQCSSKDTEGAFSKHALLSCQSKGPKF
jgi:hypothetical protein